MRIKYVSMSAIRRIRKDIFKKNQAEFAAIAGVTQATVSRWESADNGAAPTLAEMANIRRGAAELHIPWDDRWFFEMPAQESAA
jgi:transcriptional regulator with XRE-family HTH domain